jgi:TolB-like protein/tetratricopeptide (TPR) repeat protein
MSLFNELKRRNVIRVVVGYAVLSWLLLQISDVLVNALELSPVLSKTIVALLILGFIPTVVISWLYEMTPEGLKREAEISQDASNDAHSAKKLDIAIIVLLVAAIGLFAMDRFSAESAPDQPQQIVSIADGATAPVSAAIVPSIAVLPFTNMSADAENEYFSDGLADTLLHMLAQTPDLRVAARTSSFQFKGQQVDARDVGQQLNVATVLEGSVQRAGDRVRVIAQLIDTETGYHIWSETFDRDLTDIFQVQDEIAGRVAEALFESLLDVGDVVGGSAPTDVGGTESLAAYEAFMQAQQRLERRTTEDVEAGIQLLELATQLDPSYGRAWARLAEAYPYLASYGTATFGEVDDAVRVAAAKAAEVAPGLAEAQLARAMLLVLDNAPVSEVEVVVDYALSLNPNSVRALLWLADIQESKLDEGGRLRTMLAAAERDPLDVDLRRQLVDAYRDNGLVDESRATVQRVMEMDPDSVATQRMWMGDLLGRGDAVGAVRVARSIREANPELLQIYMFLARVYARLGDAETGVAYMRQAWEIRPERVHDDLALIYLTVGDTPAFLRHWADFRAFVVGEIGGSADLLGAPAQLRDIDQLTAIVEEDWAHARDLTTSLLEDAETAERFGRVIRHNVLLAGISQRLGDLAATRSHMAAAMVLVERTTALGADYPYLDLIRAVDASHRGDAEAAARFLSHGLIWDPAYNVVEDFEDFLPPAEVVATESIRALYDELASRRAEELAELHAAFPDAP